MDEEIEPRSITDIPELLHQDLPVQGCIAKLTLRDGRTIPGVCIDSKGFIYDVLVKKTIEAQKNPINFLEEDIINLSLD